MGAVLSAPQKIEHPYLKPWFALLASGGGSGRGGEASRGGIPEAGARSDRGEGRDPGGQRARGEVVHAGSERAARALPGDLMQFESFQYKQKLVEKVMEPQRFYVWLDVVQGEQASQDYEKKDGIYEYDFKRAVRFYTAEQKTKLNEMLADLKSAGKGTAAGVSIRHGDRGNNSRRI